MYHINNLLLSRKRLVNRITKTNTKRKEEKIFTFPKTLLYSLMRSPDSLLPEHKMRYLKGISGEKKLANISVF